MTSSVVDVYQNILKSTDNRDIISLNIFWENIDGIKKVIYPQEQFDNLKFYYETPQILRCFEIESLRYLKTYNINKHPLSKKEIPSYLFLNIEPIEDDELPIDKYAQDIFLQLTDANIYIEHNLFIELNDKKLSQFYYELKSFYLNNIDKETKDILKNQNILEKNYHDIMPCNFEYKQRYVLKQIKLLLDANVPSHFFIHNIIVAALNIVIPELNNDYYEYQFNTNY